MTWCSSYYWKNSSEFVLNVFKISIRMSTRKWTEKVHKEVQPYSAVSYYTNRWQLSVEQLFVAAFKLFSQPINMLWHITHSNFYHRLKWWELGEIRVGFLTTAALSSSHLPLLEALIKMWDQGPPQLLSALVLVVLVLPSSWQRLGKEGQSMETIKYQNNPCNYPWSWWPCQRKSMVKLTKMWLGSQKIEGKKMGICLSLTWYSKTV